MWVHLIFINYGNKRNQMAIILEKGGTINLNKESQGLRNIHVGLGWDAEDSNGREIDCDVSLFMINENNKIPGEGFFVFYNNLNSSDGAVIHQGDNRTGEGEGDDEVIKINLSNVSSDIIQMIFVVTIHDAEKNNQSFSMVNNAFIRIVDLDAKSELCSYQLNDQFSDADSIQIGRIYRYDNSWHFEALEQGFTGGLQTLLGMYY